MDSSSTPNLDRDTLQQRLLSAAQRDPQAPALLAARCALRSLPLFGFGEGFVFWPEPERARYFLHCATAILAVWAEVAVPEFLLLRLNEIVKNSRRFIGGDSQSSLQGEALAWAQLVGLAQQCATVAQDRDLAHASSSALASATVADQFLQALASVDTASIVQDDVMLLADKGTDAVRGVPLWLNGMPGERFAGLAGQFLDQLHRMSSLEFSAGATVAGFLQRLIAVLQQFLSGSVRLEEIRRLAEESLRYLGELQLPPVSAPDLSQPGPAAVKSAPMPAQENVGSVPEPGTRDQSQKIPTEGTSATVAEQDQAVAKELSYRPSDRQSIEQISTTDHLNRGKLVNALATILAAEGNDSHQTIGLLGDWGVGKSTLVHLLKQELIRRESQQPFLFAEFNAWAYEHTDNLQAGIAQEMLKALSSDIPDVQPPANRWVAGWRTLRWSAQRFLLTARFAIALNGKKVFWLLLMLLLAVLPFTWAAMGDVLQRSFTRVGGESSAALMGMMGAGIWVSGFAWYLFTRFKAVLANPLAKELLTYLKLPSYGEHLGVIPVMRNNIETLSRVRLATRNAKDRQTRLLFVVDDLDRCGHEGIVKVFEAVRLVLDLPRVIVLIAVDQRIALAALALHYQELAQHHQLQNPRAIARDYLAKVIHLPLLLSPPDDDSIDQYLDYIWQEQSGGVGKTAAVASGQPVADNMPTDGPREKAGQEKSQPELSSEVNDLPNADKDNVVPLRPGNLPKQEVGKGARTPADIAALPETRAGEVSTAGRSLNATEQKPGLSDPQKAAFKHWVKHFQLANPRQLKRLHNSYNLLRHYYGEDSRLEPIPERAAQALEFPLLVTLFALEYLNSLDDPPLRARLRATLRSPPPTKLEGEPEALPSLINADVIRLVNRTMPGSKAHLVDAVEPFVLPAIEQVEEAPRSQTPSPLR